MRTIPIIARLTSLAAAVVLAGSLAGCAGYASASSQPVETNRVEMPPSYRFDPETIKVVAGTTVTWHNSDNFTHSVMLSDGSSGDLVVRPGESVSIKFDKPGEYPYVCTFHAQNMKGKVIVVARQ